jgi:hypothetical protein
LSKADRLQSVNGRLHPIQAIVEMPLAAADDGLVAAEERSQHTGIEVRLPGQGHARFKVVADEFEGILVERTAKLEQVLPPQPARIVSQRQTVGVPESLRPSIPPRLLM